MKNQHLFFDSLVELFSRQAEGEIEPRRKKSPDSQNQRSTHLKKYLMSNTELQQNLIAEHLARLLNDSKIFLINGAVVDDLYNLKHDDTDYGQTFHLPFPGIFFEMMSPLEISLIGERRVKGILYGTMEKADMFKNQGSPPDQFVMNLFYENAVKIGAFPDSVYFRTSRLPNMALITNEGFFYEYTPEKGVVATLRPNYGKLYQKIKQHDPEMMRANFQRLLDLSINLLSYINAHNVTIREAGRGGPDIDVINKRRIRKSKKPLPTKSYYWIDVKKSAVGEDNLSVVSGNPLEYREWVRGHFQKYHTKDGPVKNWIEPYVRGPSNAPWKENRYRVLDDLLKEGRKLGE
jgi:hypothetical protein